MVDRVLAEESHLDFFFANAGVVCPRIDHAPLDEQERLVHDIKRASRASAEIGPGEFVEIMRINALRCAAPFLDCKD